MGGPIDAKVCEAMIQAACNDVAKRTAVDIKALEDKVMTMYSPVVQGLRTQMDTAQVQLDQSKVEWTLMRTEVNGLLDAQRVNAETSRLQMVAADEKYDKFEAAVHDDVKREELELIDKEAKLQQLHVT